MTKRAAEKQSAPISRKGGKREGAGRKPGIPNKYTKELKEMILSALDEAGGIAYLVERAHDPKTAGAFIALIGKTLPLTLQGTGEGGGIVLQLASTDARL